MNYQQSYSMWRWWTIEEIIFADNLEEEVANIDAGCVPDEHVAIRHFILASFNV